MSDFFQPVKLTDTVYWVGVIDWDVRDFHGYSTMRGTTYNAYLIVTDRVTLIDTVKESFVPEMMSRISRIVSPEDISCIISNHAEIDHSGGLPRVASMVKPDRILASKMGVRTLREHFNHCELNLEEVKTGDTLDLGTRTLRFMETRMLHWPDSMFTYMPEEKLLFSQDAFGMHLATAERFADLVGPTIVYREMAKYYANILLPYSDLVLKLLDHLEASKMKIDIIANDHGPVFRRDIANVIGWYRQWAEQKPTNLAIIVYDTMWGSTQKMAKVIADGIYKGGGRALIMPMGGSHRSDVATELLHAGALVVGSPTLNNNIFPTMADVLVYLKGLRPKNLIGAAFGSYGWGGEAVAHIRGYLEEMNIDVQSEKRVKYVPDDADLDECYQMGITLGYRLAENSQ
ncbi:FprA family A-type flavoprotein [bacterium]|nr:FprA family A-type flavoprotein [candidate division CSSED10-310 bacterium]